MILDLPGQRLANREVPSPAPGPGQVLVQVKACAVCRTDLHILDHELTSPKLPLILGHEIIGIVVETTSRFSVGDRVGIPWLGWTCARCGYCRSGRENLCEAARFTGYTLDGGYAEMTVADERYCFLIPQGYGDAEAAPLLCAGFIGYRSYLKTGNRRRIGIYGFGAAAHIITQVAVYQGREVYAFTRPGDTDGQEFARSLGAAWAGDSDQMPPAELDAAIIFAPAGSLVPHSLRALGKGGIVVCGGIHMSDIPSFPYELLWQERQICSVANLTRQDGEEFLSIAPKVPVHTHVETYPLTEANEVLDRLRMGRVRGAAVLLS